MSDAGIEAWWAAMQSLNQFEDGSLVILDDSLDVDGGDEVTLWVKLGARPRSDVTVALSETSDLISLDPESLTFTRETWDVYQPVTVTAAGNRQVIDVPASQFGKGVNRVFWSGLAGPQIVAALTPTGTDRYLSGLSLEGTGRSSSSVLNFKPTSAGSEEDNADLSSEFETSGSYTVEADGQSILVSMDGADLSDPYVLPRTAVASEAALNAMVADLLLEANGSVAATLTLRDYVPGDVTIGLSASGPAEYEGKTGSATVTVD